MGAPNGALDNFRRITAKERAAGSSSMDYAAAMKTILVAVDLSAATVRVCAAAERLARSMGARLVIFHAVPAAPVLAYGFDGFSAGEMVGYHRATRKASAHKMTALEHWFKKRWPNTKMALHDGPAPDNIVRAANRLRADYIVIGSHGHGAVYELLVGSTAHLVLKKSRCPVVLVPITKQTGKGRLKLPGATRQWPMD